VPYDILTPTVHPAHCLYKCIKYVALFVVRTIISLLSYCFSRGSRTVGNPTGAHGICYIICTHTHTMIWRRRCGVYNVYNMFEHHTPRFTLFIHIIRLRVCNIHAHHTQYYRYLLNSGHRLAVPILYTWRTPRDIINNRDPSTV